MSNKSHNPGHTQTTCSACKAEAHSKKGTTHRRCAGQPNIPIKNKHEGMLPASGRGTWQ